MDIVNIWNDVGSSIGFYTKESSYKIPDSPGIYAWFIPLWIYNHDIYELINLAQSAMLYDADIKHRNTEFQGAAERDGRMEFNWDYININLKKSPKMQDSSSLKDLNDLEGSSKEFAAFSESLMKASVFTKPLYIGRADILSVRYYQHVEGTKDKNNFHTRFKEFIEQSHVKLDVDDLLFACIPITQKSNDALKERDLTSKLESILMNIVYPPFSCK